MVGSKSPRTLLVLYLLASQALTRGISTPVLTTAGGFTSVGSHGSLGGSASPDPQKPVSIPLVVPARFKNTSQNHEFQSGTRPSANSSGQRPGGGTPQPPTPLPGGFSSGTSLPLNSPRGPQSSAIPPTNPPAAGHTGKSQSTSTHSPVSANSPSGDGPSGRPSSSGPPAPVNTPSGSSRPSDSRISPDSPGSSSNTVPTVQPTTSQSTIYQVTGGSTKAIPTMVTVNPSNQGESATPITSQPPASSSATAMYVGLLQKYPKSVSAALKDWEDAKKNPNDEEGWKKAKKSIDTVLPPDDKDDDSGGGIFGALFHKNTKTSGSLKSALKGVSKVRKSIGPGAKSIGEALGGGGLKLPDLPAILILVFIFNIVVVVLLLFLFLLFKFQLLKEILIIILIVLIFKFKFLEKILILNILVFAIFFVFKFKFFEKLLKHFHSTNHHASTCMLQTTLEVEWVFSIHSNCEQHAHVFLPLICKFHFLQKTLGYIHFTNDYASTCMLQTTLEVECAFSIHSNCEQHAYDFLPLIFKFQLLQKVLGYVHSTDNHPSTCMLQTTLSVECAFPTYPKCHKHANVPQFNTQDLAHQIYSTKHGYPQGEICMPPVSPAL
ncbi:hypothetical protein NUU61_009490 [Penicillium alfredii]|uniref:Uncharacterized protein n=1 Tax=Penicillium alfredii TaxID=1506179 RepID=A0A9W9ENH1_9EURO|nr:uncharacterized protein NUU61_009490 [Penicillium alfredii]KAJ5084911.1 hypothetical protein NUU61_009490 [Penicillium alfredii]